MTVFQRISEFQAADQPAFKWFKTKPKNLRLALARGLREWAQAQILRDVDGLTLGEIFKEYGHCLAAYTGEFEVIALTYGTDRHPYVVGWTEASKDLRRGDLGRFPLFAQAMYMEGWDRGRNDLQCNTNERYRQ